MNRQFPECVLALMCFLQCIQQVFSCCYFDEYEHQNITSFQQANDKGILISCKQLELSKERKNLSEPCQIHVQCSGNGNAICGENNTCVCDKGNLRVQDKCVLDRKNLDEPCQIHVQCSGNGNAVCGENNTCVCDKGNVKVQDKCVLVNRSVGLSCKHNLQCTGTENGGRCLEGKCSCDERYILHKMECQPDSLYLENDKELLIVGGGVVCVIIILITIAVAVKIRKRDTNSSDRDPRRNTMHPGTDRVAEEGSNLECYHKEDIYSYNHLHEEVSRKSEHDEVYDDTNIYSYLSL
uniref:Uncharacterized protein LOC111106384 n=1 Tax=Crassostrea virginica TaxID=6565 RepID=A0A8B8B010_CRAVI|nr:uncharacterized protein LOC111106384 [Crassostrea virginica]XP_022296745.1 uncharacterized protein LOC111106384 [Crassostrea virginica]XP_022296746.1 uncharacterized protein LOC111106384 [Crassostrea virginica]XP_022296747.1 uncharacterized protein LOC111106384 [Crassostrea virginica]